jgi:uncharacterized protein (TIGR03382 family)
VRTDMITLACGAVALALYFTGQIVPAGVAIAVGMAVLVWSVMRRR